MQRHRIDSPPRIKRSRIGRTPQIPKLHRPILRSTVQIPPIPLKTQTRNISRMPLQCQYGILIGGIVDFKEANVGIASRGEVLFVGGDFEAVDLTVGVAEDAGADSGGGFPEADFIVLAGSG